MLLPTRVKYVVKANWLACKDVRFPYKSYRMRILFIYVASGTELILDLYAENRLEQDIRTFRIA